MHIASRRSRYSSLNIWPGFVDALATLLMVLIFVLLVFVLAQFFLGEALSGREAAVARLEAQVADLADVLAVEQRAKDDLGRQVTRLSDELQASLAARNDLTARLSAKDADLARAAADIAALSALEAQLERDASAKKAAEQQVQITALGQRLNAALAGKVAELARYRSEFFGRMREILGDNPDIRIVGDRFVFPSEVLFAVR